MKKNTTETIIRIIESTGTVSFKLFAVMFAVLTLYAVVCFFQGDGIIALMGAAAGALCTRTMWNL